MKIGVDAISLDYKNTGIGKYTINILNKISEQSSHEIIIFSSNQEAIQAFFNPKIKIVQMPIASQNKYIRILNEHIVLPIIAQKYHLDLFFCPFYTSPTFSPVKKVVVIHDMIYKSNDDKDHFARALYRQLFFTLSILRAKRILTISENTKKDILKYYPHLKNIDVIYLGIPDYHSKNKVRPKIINENDRFLLTVGSITPRKNNLRTIQAFEALNDKDLKIVIAGDIVPGQSEEVITYIKENNLSDRVIVTGYISDEELAWCYQNAEMLIYCSLFEGFGLPPFEAMQCGTPVIASNVTSIPEVVGDAALLVDPYSITDISNAINKVLTDNIYRQQLIDKGYAHHQRFSWDKTARETIKVFESIG
jgi:glycosyltransferase involved in cell wall biosynthesis